MTTDDRTTETTSSPAPTQQERSQGAIFDTKALRISATCGRLTRTERNLLWDAADEIDRLRAELATWKRNVLEAQVPTRAAVPTEAAVRADGWPYGAGILR